MALDLLLINPYSSNPNPMIPLGLGFLAAVARDAGFTVQVVDAWAEELHEEHLLRRRLQQVPPPRVTGVSVLTPNLRGARVAITVTRQTFPETLLVIGGPHVSALPEEALQEFPEVDLGVYGEGELTLRELLQTYRSSDPTPRGLAGTIWREGTRVIQGMPREPIQDLDSLPRPARDLFPLAAYRPHPPYGRRWRYMNEITSRGCPFRCAYCSKSVFGNSYRAFSLERVMADLRDLADRYHVREIHFYDDDLTMNHKRAMELMERMIAAKLDLIWSCTTRCDLVDRELLQLMKKAGCWMISYGVESGNDALLKTVAKGITRDQIETAVRETRAAGIEVTAYFMIGLPGETEETVRETIAFMNRLRPDYVNWAVMTVYPGSPFYSDIQAGQYGPGTLVRRDELAGARRSPFQDALLYGFAGALSHARMEALARRATRLFYFRPRQIWRILGNIRSLRQLRQTVRIGWSLLRWLATAGAKHERVAGLPEG